MVGNKFAPKGAKGFFAFHVEKVVLGVCVGLVALFFCLGWGVEVLPEDQTPERLFKLVDQGKKHMAKPEIWEDIQPTREIEANHLDRAVRSRTAVAVDPYELPKLWSMVPVPLNERRTDPELYAPERVIAHAFVAPVAQPRTASATNPWSALPVATREVEAPPMAVARQPRTPRRRPRGIDLECPSILEEPCPPEECPPEECPPLDEDAMVFAPVGGLQRRLSQAQLDELLRDSWRTTQIVGDLAVTGATIVAVTATVPYKQQSAEFERCFDGAMGYDKMRDRPEYNFFVAERAEVPADGPVDVASLTWERITNTTWEQSRNQYWSFSKREEVVDPKHIHAALTSTIPPVALVDAVKFAAHPDVSFRTVEKIEQDKRALLAPKPVEATGGMPPTGDIAADPSGISGVPTTTVPRPSDYVPSEDPEFDSGSEEIYDDETGSSMSTAMVKPVEIGDKLLVRFYDYKAARGKSYVYRVKVFLRDPNNPQPAPSRDARSGQVQGMGGFHPPVPDRSLTVEALDRVRANRAKATPQFYIETDYSEPSSVVTVPSLPMKLLAGPVTAPRTMALQTGARVTRDAEKGKVLSVVWDDKLGTYVPGEIEAVRGTVLNFTATADILHPLTYAIKRAADYVFQTNAVVLDIRGGESIGKTGMNTPGEMLLVDKDGNLIVRNEFDTSNVQMYRQQLFIEDRAEVATPTTPGAPFGSPLNPLEGGPSPLGR